MQLRAWDLAKETVFAFIDDEALSRGAAIAFYTATSIAPLLLIVVAIAGLVFGREAALGAISDQLAGLMGRQTAELLETAVANASAPRRGLSPALLGIAALIATASGAFGGCNRRSITWKAKPRGRHRFAPDPRARCEPRPGRHTRLPAGGVACGQRRSHRVRRALEGAAQRQRRQSARRRRRRRRPRLRRQTIPRLDDRRRGLPHRWRPGRRARQRLVLEQCRAQRRLQRRHGLECRGCPPRPHPTARGLRQPRRSAARSAIGCSWPQASRCMPST